MRLIDVMGLKQSIALSTMLNDGKTLEQIIDEQPTIEERKTGHWIEIGQNKDGTHNICCGVCGKFKIKSRGHANSAYTKSKYRFCGGCGAKLEVEHETD